MKYKVTIYRTEYNSLDFEVEANSPEEAEDAATEQAENMEWNRGNAEYEAEVHPLKS
jgi:hypothetical protein